MKEKRWYAFGDRYSTLSGCGFYETASLHEAKQYAAYYTRAWDCEEPQVLHLEYSDAECRAEVESRRAEEAKRKLNK